jgi:uncharacterized protein (UPF0332 family)
MPFAWSDFLTLAEELSRRNDEAALRTAASRAYYYVYHLGRQRILDNGFPLTRGADTHKQVWEKFEADPDPRCKKLQDLAKRLHDKRKQADYDIPYPKIEKEFPALLDMAKKFALDLNALDKRLPSNRGMRL